MQHEDIKETKELNEVEMEKIAGGKRRSRDEYKYLSDEEKEKLKEFEKRVSESM